jgi:hypothetical protein
VRLGDVDVDLFLNIAGLLLIFIIACVWIYLLISIGPDLNDSRPWAEKFRRDQ